MLRNPSVLLVLIMPLGLMQSVHAATSPAGDVAFSERATVPGLAAIRACETAAARLTAEARAFGEHC